MSERFSIAVHVMVLVTFMILLSATGFYMFATMFLAVPLETCLFSIAVTGLLVGIIDVLVLTAVILSDAPN